MQSRMPALLVVILLGILTREALAQRRGKRPARKPDKIKQGDPAPNFTLKSPDGKRTVALGDFQGKRPVALVFGSYT